MRFYGYVIERVHDVDMNERNHAAAKMPARAQRDAQDTASAVKGLGEPTMIKIAHELVATVRKNRVNRTAGTARRLPNDASASRRSL